MALGEGFWLIEVLVWLVMLFSGNVTELAILIVLRKLDFVAFSSPRAWC